MLKILPFPTCANKKTQKMTFLFRLHDQRSKKLVFESCLVPATCRFQCGRDCTLHVDACASHLSSVFNVQVKRATDPAMGLGLFAVGAADDLVFDKGQRIVEYKGQLLSLEAYAQRYGQNESPFAMQLTAHTFIDPAIVRGVGSYINHSPNSGANCRYSRSGGKVFVVATRPILGGTELRANYNSGRKFLASVYETAPVDDAAKPLCYCSKPDDGELYVECSGGARCWRANGWVHAKCAGLREIPDTFTCAGCQEANWCYCQKPDTADLYLECSGGAACPANGWVHFSCSGLASVPEVFTCKHCAA